MIEHICMVSKTLNDLFLKKRFSECVRKISPKLLGRSTWNFRKICQVIIEGIIIINYNFDFLRPSKVFHQKRMNWMNEFFGKPLYCQPSKFWLVLRTLTIFIYINSKYFWFLNLRFAIILSRQIFLTTRHLFRRSCKRSATGSRHSKSF